MDRRAVLAEILKKTQDIDLPYLLASKISYPFETSPVDVLAARNTKLVDGPALMAFWSSAQDELPAGAPEDTPRETRPVVYTELLPEGQSLTIEQFAAKAETIWNTVFKGNFILNLNCNFFPNINVNRTAKQLYERCGD
jgi:hypothetical protein